MAPKIFWRSLAPEIRLMILQMLIQDEPSVARYAAVCREWQAIIERKIFNRITLTNSRLAEFRDITYRRQELVKYIWLCIELEEYDCTRCEEPECYKSNTTIIGKAIQDLFLVLTTWKPSDILVLDISVHSPSDSKHYFKYLQFGSNALPGPETKHTTTRIHDPSHGWVNGEQVSLPPLGSRYRVFSDIGIELDFFYKLPKVTAVTGLLLRRQTRRRRYSNSLNRLIQLLPRLQEIYYESWRGLTLWEQPYTDKGYQCFFESLFRNQLKCIVLFEDFNDNYISVFDGEIRHIRKADLGVSKALVRASLDLEHLSASFIIDASDFFLADPKYTWNNLVSLALTLQLLVPSENHGTINDTLQTAAVAALQMPKLNVMELWNGGKGFAGAFSYQIYEDFGPATISWRGSWNLALEPRVIQSWEAVALKRTPCDLQVVRELLDAAVINSHGDAITHLKLSHEVMCPVSLWQIKNEMGY